MSRTIVAIAISITITIGFLARCISSQRGPHSEEMYIKASALTKLSAAVESTVRYKNPALDLGDDELLNLATRHDLVLLGNFRGAIRSGCCGRVLRQGAAAGCCGRNATRLYSYVMRPVPARFWKTQAVPGRWIANAG